MIFVVALILTDGFGRLSAALARLEQFEPDEILILTVLLAAAVSAVYFLKPRYLRSDIRAPRGTEASDGKIEAGFRAIFEHSPHSTYLLDADGRFVLANREFRNRFGLAEEEIIGKKGTDLQPANVAAYYANANRQVLEKNERFEGLIDQVYPDGTPRVNLVVKFPIRDETGRPIQIGTINTDIGVLQRTEAALRATYQHAAVGIAHVRPDGQLIRVNPKMCEILGYSEPELIGHGYRDVTHPDDRDADAPFLRKIDTGEIETFSLEKRYLRKDGGPIWAHVTVSAVRLPSGKSDYYVAIIQDISDRRRAEDALRVSERRLAHAQAIAHLGSFEREIASGSVYWSDETFRILGLDPSTATASFETYLDAMHSEDRAGVVATLEKATLDKRSFDHEFRIVRPDGDVRNIHEFVQFELDDEGKPALLRGAILDLTATKQAEMERHEVEERFRAIVENSPSAIFLKDLDGKFRLINRRFEEWYGVGQDEAVGKTSYDIYPKEFADRYVAQDLEVIETGQTRERELDVPFADGTVHSILVTKFPVVAPDGRTIGIGTINTDVTEQRRAEEQLHQAQKMEAVGQLTGGVAHDFNNLLTVILGNLEFLEKRMEGNADGMRFIDTSMRAVRRGSDLTQRLLAFSRRQPLSPAPVDTNRLVGRMTELLHRALGETIEIETIQTSGLWPAMVDRAQLENAILNLALNARDAMPDGGKLTIETANASIDRAYADTHAEVAPGQYVMIAVSDTGYGIAPELMPRVFDPFFTTKGEGQGSGLGLSMVFGFVKQTGGHVNLYSEVDEGTTVKLYLPRAADETLAAEPTIDGGLATGSGESILVVEDDADVREYVVTALANLGYRVLEADDGRAAMDIIDSTEAIDMLFTDVVLPGGMNGRAIAEEAKKRRPEIRILFTSGYTENAVVHHGRLDDGVTLLAKPYTQETLARMIRAMLRDEPERSG